jgi:hypothetical protein
MRPRVNTQFSATTQPTTQTSGTFKLAKLLSHPKPLPFNYLDTLKNVLCYVIRKYADDGLSVLISRKNEDVAVLFGDWNGNLCDIREDGPAPAAAKLFMEQHLNDVYALMKYIKIDMLQMFIDTSAGFRLVDIQLSLNKYTGPGMLRDVFNPIIDTQEVLVIEPLADRALEAIRHGTGTYEGNLIIKPSKFRLYEDGGAYFPHYVSVTR